MKSTTTTIKLPIAPKWLLEQEGATQRQWKKRKRAELKKVIEVFSDYRMGCAYCPSVNGEVGEIGRLLDQMKQAHSVKNWGR